MKNRFNWAVALFLLSFFLPVLEGFMNPEQYLTGWQLVIETYFPRGKGIYSSRDLEVLYFIVAIIPNPLVLITIILVYLKKGSATLKWALSITAVIAALFWMPFFFSILFDYFSLGYWTWLVAIFMIHFYANEGTFKRPKKHA